MSPYISPSKRACTPTAPTGTPREAIAQTMLWYASALVSVRLSSTAGSLARSAAAASACCAQRYALWKSASPHLVRARVRLRLRVRVVEERLAAPIDPVAPLQRAHPDLVAREPPLEVAHVAHEAPVHVRLEILARELVGPMALARVPAVEEHATHARPPG